MIKLETDRLCLRPLTRDDFAGIYRCASDKNIVKYMIWGPFDENGTDRYLQKCASDWRAEPVTRYAFGIVLRKTGALIGACWLHLEDSRRCGELGWVLHSDWWRQGFMSEAAGALLRFSFEDLRLHRVCAHARAENSGSFKIMEKYGMRREGHYIQCDPVRFAETEAWADVYLYAMLDTEYFTARQQDHHGAERL